MLHRILRAFRAFVQNENLKGAMARNEQAAHELDAAVKEMLGR